MKRRIIIICVGVLMALPIVAQEFKIGAVAGLNLNVPSDLKSGVGFRVGVKGELALPDVANGLYAESGLTLSSIPWKTEKLYNSQTGITAQDKATPYYLNIPLHVGYKWNCGQNAKFFINAGPYLNIGLFGKIKNTAMDTNHKELHSVSLNYFSYVGSDHRVDWGLGFGTGFELAKHYQMSIGYEWGMRDIVPSPSYNYRNHTFTFQLAYMF
jgi:hypothetical protein